MFVNQEMYDYVIKTKFKFYSDSLEKITEKIF